MADTSTQAMAIGSNVKGTATNQSVPGSPIPVATPLEQHFAWPMIARLPVMLAVNIPLRGFKVCDLLNLGCGQAIESAWTSSEDVSLKVGSLQIGWGEFEVVEERMALRLTRLA